jgi:hypothetical protein
MAVSDPLLRWEKIIYLWHPSRILFRKRIEVSDLLDKAPLSDEVKKLFRRLIVDNSLEYIQCIERLIQREMIMQVAEEEIAMREDTRWSNDVEMVEDTVEDVGADVDYIDWLECSGCSIWHEVSPEVTTAFSGDAAWHCPSCCEKK